MERVTLFSNYSTPPIENREVLTTYNSAKHSESGKRDYSNC